VSAYQSISQRPVESGIAGENIGDTKLCAAEPCKVSYIEVGF
jgi:hypothetical protein